MHLNANLPHCKNSISQEERLWRYDPLLIQRIKIITDICNVNKTNVVFVRDRSHVSILGINNRTRY